MGKGGDMWKSRIDIVWYGLVWYCMVWRAEVLYRVVSHRRVVVVWRGGEGWTHNPNAVKWWKPPARSRGLEGGGNWVKSHSYH